MGLLVELLMELFTDSTASGLAAAAFAETTGIVP